MAAHRNATIPAVAQKSLRQWIEADDGDTTGSAPPACSARVQALHAAIFTGAEEGADDRYEPLAAPPGLRLPPLG